MSYNLNGVPFLKVRITFLTEAIYLFEMLQLNSTCAEEVQRVMQERAAHVDLHPEIERVCMGELGKYCSSHTGPGEEIACLQDNMEM